MMKHAETVRFDIFIAGDIEQAKQVCREYCYQIGLCVTIEPVAYIYTGGEEAGVRIGLINYPRFPVDETELELRAMGLAEILKDATMPAFFLGSRTEADALVHGSKGRLTTTPKPSTLLKHRTPYILPP
jgi:hypothetical protein